MTTEQGRIMGFHSEELERIKKATSGMFKKKTRERIAYSLLRLSMHLEVVGKRSDQEIEVEIKKLVNAFSSARQQALANGAKGYSDPDWAEAAACESWVQAMMLNTDPQEMAKVNQLVHELIERAR